MFRYDHRWNRDPFGPTGYSVSGAHPNVPDDYHGVYDQDWYYDYDKYDEYETKGGYNYEYEYGYRQGENDEDYHHHCESTVVESYTNGIRKTTRTTVHTEEFTEYDDGHPDRARRAAKRRRQRQRRRERQRAAPPPLAQGAANLPPLPQPQLQPQLRPQSQPQFLAQQAPPATEFTTELSTHVVLTIFGYRGELSVMGQKLGNPGPGEHVMRLVRDATAIEAVKTDIRARPRPPSWIPDQLHLRFFIVSDPVPPSHDIGLGIYQAMETCRQELESMYNEHLDRQAATSDDRVQPDPRNTMQASSQQGPPPLMEARQAPPIPQPASRSALGAQATRSRPRHKDRQGATLGNRVQPNPAVTAQASAPQAPPSSILGQEAPIVPQPPAQPDVDSKPNNPQPFLRMRVFGFESDLIIRERTFKSVGPGEHRIPVFSYQVDHVQSEIRNLPRTYTWIPKDFALVFCVERGVGLGYDQGTLQTMGAIRQRFKGLRCAQGETTGR